MKKKYLFLLVLLIIFKNTVWSQKKVLVTKSTTENITIDGKFNEKAWINADVATDFVMFEPDNGKPISADKKTEIKISLFVISTVLALVAGFRGPSVGADTGTYVELFDDVSLIKQEPGFRALCEAIHLFTDSSTVFQIVCAYIINGGMAIACYRLSQKPFMSMTLWVLFFYYFASFNGTRQYIAIVILV